MSAADAEKLREKHQRLFGGSNRGKTVLIDDGGKFTPVPTGNKTAQFIETYNPQGGEVVNHVAVVWRDRKSDRRFRRRMMALSMGAVCVSFVAAFFGGERLSLLAIVAFAAFIASWAVHDSIDAKHGKYCPNCIEGYPGDAIGSDRMREAE